MPTQFNINLDEKTKVIITSAVIVFVTFFICSSITKRQIRKGHYARSKIEEERKKLVLRQEIGKIEIKRNEYIKHFHDNLNQQDFRSTISGFAGRSDVEIVSIKSAGIKDVANISKSLLAVSLRCTYNQLVDFLAKIEKLTEIIKIEELSVAGLVDFKGYLTENEDRKTEVMESDTKATVSFTIAAYSIKH